MENSAAHERSFIPLVRCAFYCAPNAEQLRLVTLFRLHNADCEVD